MSEPLRVLFVCTANICRSPLMELTARSMAESVAGPAPGVEFASAGTHGFTDHPMDEVMSGTLAAGAADAFRSRPLDPAILAGADLVLTAEASHRALILAEEPALVRRVFTLGQFAAAVTELTTADPSLRGRELVAAVGSRRTAPRPEHDVGDPYRRGIEAAETTAGTISTMLSVIVPSLVEAGADRRAEA